MTDNFENAIRMITGLFSGRSSVSAQELDEAVDRYIVPLAGSGPFSGVDPDALKQELRNIYGSSVAEARILEGRERRAPWLKEFRQSHSSWSFWEDYRKYLLDVKHMHRSSVNELDRLTDMTLDRLFDPTQTDIHIHKKGMVVGQVQSGKTSNYTGLICKAADVGFNVVIVLAGMHNNLRSQTQLRLDEGFLGFDTQYDRAYRLNSNTNMGVGTLHTGHPHPVAHSYTTSLESGDFRRRVAEGQGFNFNTGEPILLVVKKNVSVLSNLDNWLMTKISPEEKCSTKSLLVIDDEADNASINTARGDTPTAINGWIRSIMSRFHRVGYVGYTATPFANIFIPEDDSDLFPRDFIINLPVPENYIGPERVFGLDQVDNPEPVEILPVVNTIDDFDSFVPTGHRKWDPLPQFEDIPQSLKKAVKCFILTCAARIARGQEHSHNSMLVHVSRYTNWQEEIKYLVEKVFTFYKDEVEYGDPRIFEEFRSLYEDSSETYASYVQVTEKVLSTDMAQIDPQIRPTSWSEVKANLKKAVSRITVRSINGSSADVLSYYENPNGLYAIVIGGDKLSRGLTLEGLSVSYFLRASKMYDTLMQMGRWFGYRPGYADLCRLFISPELNEWFRHITTASDELRKEFDYLCDIGGTPDAYGLKVRSHPGALQITASNKMRYVRRLQLSWAGRLVESYAIPTDIGRKNANFMAARDLASALPAEHRLSGSHYLWKGVPSATVTDFISKFHIASSLRSADLELVLEYIRNLNLEGELRTWNVVFINKTADRTSVTEYPNGITVGNSKRSCAEGISDNVYCIRNNHIISSGDEFLDLSREQLQEALELTRRVKENAGKEWTSGIPNGSIVRELYRTPDQPLLLVYTLDPYYADGDDDSAATRRWSHDDEPFVGFAMAFPHTETGFTVSYVSNMIEDFEHTDTAYDEDGDDIDNTRTDQQG